LVRGDADLNIIPSLAVSWGLLDDVTWEFRLRPDVVFHDGSKFDANDVVASINRAKDFKGSGLKDFVETISDVEVVDDLILRITTDRPDPLLLQKISRVLIFPSDFEMKDTFLPIGTAPYKVFSHTPDKVVLTKNNNYWGRAAKFEQVEIFSFVDKSDRVNNFLTGQADLLAFVPYDAVKAVLDKGFEIVSVPTLEVQFLLFNFDSKYLSLVDARRAVSLALDQNNLVDEIGGYARPVSQFVGTGVFGYNPNIENHIFSVAEAVNYAKLSGLEGKTLKFHLQKGLNVLGEQVRRELFDAGVFVIISYLDVDELLESFDNGDADIYFLGFKSELGDSFNFLNSIVRSDGDFNVGNYQNETIDFLINESLVELDQQKRQSSLQEVMQVIVNEDIIGVPLFEYENVFSFVGNIDLVPRVDGLIYFDDVIIK
jgi:peptide/nickel transport system substrate-binding protein